MTARLAIIHLLLGALVLILASAEFSGDVAAQEALRLHISEIQSSRFPVVEANVVVEDPAGRPVHGLNQQSFRAFDGDRPVVVSGVTRAVDAGTGMAVVLVVDVSGSMAGAPLAQAKQVARDFVLRLSDRDNAMLVSLSTAPAIAHPFTADKASMLRAIDNLKAGGDTALYDAAIASSSWAASADLPRRAVVLLSDGADFGGRSSGSREGSLEAAAARGVSFFTVGLGPSQDRDYLTRLAAVTQGQAFYAASPADLAPLYQNIHALLAEQYIVRVDFGHGTPPGGHKLQLVASNGSSAGSGERAFEAFPSGYRPPQVTLPMMAAGQTIDQPLRLLPLVQSSGVIKAVRYLLDGRLVAETNASPYEHILDPLDFPPGEHRLQLEAMDDAGVTGRLEVSLVVPGLPPRLRLLRDGRPLDGDDSLSIEGPFRLEAEAEGQGGVESVRLLVDGQVIETLQSLPYRFELDPAAYGKARLEVSVVARDSSGRETNVAASFDVQLPARAGGGANAALLVAGGLGVAAVVLAGSAGLWLRGRRRSRALAAAPPVPVAPAIPLPQPPTPVEAQEAAGPAARLTVWREDTPEERQVMEMAGDPVTIGSGPGCDLRLLQDGVEAQQMRIWRREDKFMVHAIVPAARTVVAGKPISWAVLEDGDEIEIGSFRLKFELLEGQRL